MDEDAEVLRRLYAAFNARDVDGATALMAEDVAWANGMDGGHVHGREAVRAYWTHQWSVVSPHVEPLRFRRAAEGTLVAEVRQTVRDLQGQPVEHAAHGLRDKVVEHAFRLRGGEVARFDIPDADGA